MSFSRNNRRKSPNKLETIAKKLKIPVLEYKDFKHEASPNDSGSSEVYRSEYINPSCILALKKLNDANAIFRATNEITVLSQLQHPNILPIEGVCTDTEKLPCIATPWAPRGALEALLGNNEFTFEIRLSVATQLCDALAYMHGIGYLHCDIKPANVFVWDNYRIKLADFDLSCLEKDSRSCLGTIGYCAPEVITRSATNSLRSDMYSFGIVLFELISNTPLHVNDDLFATACSPETIEPATRNLLASRNRYEKIQQKMTEMDALNNYPQSLTNLVKRCLDENPELRPSAVEALGILQSAANQYKQKNLPAKTQPSPTFFSSSVQKETMSDAKTTPETELKFYKK